MVGGVCGHSLSMGRQFSSSVGSCCPLWVVIICGWMVVLGWQRLSFVGGGWWSLVVVLSFVIVGSCGHGRSLSGKQLLTWNAQQGVPCQQFGGGALCWAPSPLPSPFSTSVIIVGIVVIVGIVGVVVVSGGVSRCVVVVVSDGGGDG